MGPEVALYAATKIPYEIACPSAPSCQRRFDPPATPPFNDGIIRISLSTSPNAPTRTVAPAKTTGGVTLLSPSSELYWPTTTTNRYLIQILREVVDEYYSRSTAFAFGISTK
jgi:hypothetical protein